MAHRWLCKGCGQEVVPGVTMCETCEPAITEEPTAASIEKGLYWRNLAYFMAHPNLHDPDDAEDLAEGSPYIWDLPEEE